MDWTLEVTAPTGKLAEALRGARMGLAEEDPSNTAADDQVAACIAAVEALAESPVTGGDRWYKVTVAGTVNADGEGNTVSLVIDQAEEPDDSVVASDPEAPVSEEFAPAPATGSGATQPEDTEAFATGSNQAQTALKEGQAETEAEAAPPAVDDTMTRAELDEVAAAEISGYDASQYATKADVIEAIEANRAAAPA